MAGATVAALALSEAAAGRGDTVVHGGILEATFRGGYARAGLGKGRLLAEPVVLWSARVGREIGYPGQAVMALDYVFVGSFDPDERLGTSGAVRAYKGTSGEEIWHRPTSGAVWTSPTYDDGRVFAGTDDSVPSAGDGALYAFNARSGAELWRFPTRGRIWGAVCVRKGTVFVPSGDHFLYALGAADGRERFDAFDAGGPLMLSPACAGDRVYIVVDPRTKTDSSRVIALEITPKGFKEIWSYDLGTVISLGLAVSGKTLIGADRSGAVIAFDTKKGKVRWRADAPGPVVDAPAVADGTVFACASDEGCRAFSLADGSTKWTSGESLLVRGAPIYGGGILYVARNRGDHGSEVYALDAKDGRPLWSVRVDGTTRSSLGLFDGVLLHGTERGVLYALGVGPAPGVASASKGSAPKGDTSFTCDSDKPIHGDDVPRGPLAGVVRGRPWKVEDGAAVRMPVGDETGALLWFIDRPYETACEDVTPRGATAIGLLLEHAEAETFSRPGEVRKLVVSVPDEAERKYDRPRAWVEVKEAAFEPGGVVRGRLMVCMEDGSWIGGEFSLPSCRK